MSESTIQSRILRALGSLANVRVFRNQVGVGWVGKAHRDGENVFIVKARRVSMGLHVGSSDVIGWKSLVITPDMVGSRIAQFVSVEVKTDTGRTTPEQQNWIQQVNRAGGIAIVARSPEEAVEEVNRCGVTL